MAFGSAFQGGFSFIGFLGLFLGAIASFKNPLFGIIVILCNYYWPIIQFGSKYSSYPIAIILVIFTMLSVLINYKKTALFYKKNNIIYFFLVLICIYALCSLFYTPNITNGIRYFNWAFRGFSIFLLVIIVINEATKLSDFLKIYSIIGFLTFVICLIQYYTGLSHNWILIKHNSGLLDMYERLVFWGTEPNYLSLLYLPPLISTTICKKQSREFWEKTFWSIVQIGICIGILGTYSRAGMICLIFILICSCFIDKKNIIISFLFLLIIPIYIYFYQHALLIRFESIYKSVTEEGLEGRTYFWMKAIDIFMSNPKNIFVGIGLGGYVTRVGDAVHNTLLAILVDLGLVGLFIYYSPIILIISMSISRMIKNGKNITRSFFLLGFFASFLGILSISDIGSIPVFISLAILFCYESIYPESLSMDLLKMRNNNSGLITN
ncbi:O-antigen ligase family protein [Leptolinea tardivitalis]|nr:O-antigen ligase family protein [Leptolinea tardivitalis]GAP23072.1 O-antigen ligase like membrane protein [Leptolinea tardivitalis]